MFDFGKSQDRTRKTFSVFASFVMCCLGTSLMISSLATQYWFQSGCKIGGEESPSSGVHFGLFTGRNNFVFISSLSYDVHIVCEDGDCMYSCARNADLRRTHLELVKAGAGSNFSTDNCDPVNEALAEMARSKTVPLVALGGLSRSGEVGVPEGDLFVGEVEMSSTDSYMTTTEEVNHGPEFMSYGLWVGTISCLALGMVFAVVGALFAVINTATTPVEFITGVPGLYIWNSLAAFFNLICVILWAVQFHQHLTKNVLLYDADAGWTTAGMEVFGYSYWLVVVAIIVHIANIVIIFVGTYERKAKEEVRKPEEKSVNLMLY